MSIKKLFDIEIDEVSVVDRPANQHGLIAFAKNDEGFNEEGQVPEVYDEVGESVDIDVLEHGDVVYDAEGNEFVFVEDGDVEKGAGQAGARFGSNAEEAAEAFVRSRKRKLAAGAAAGGTGLAGAGYGAGRYRSQHMKKSLGDSVLEDLSKAVTDYDREMVIAKAMDEVEIAKAQAAEAFEYAAAIEDARIEDAFISKAAEYNLPVSPEVLGPILKSIAETLTDEELDILDELFASVGDSLYNEIGYVGDTANVSVLDTVDGLAQEFVGKSDVSYEQAYSAMFEANPSAYDAYLSEGRY